MATTYCPHCAAETIDGTRFCAACGQALSASGELEADRLLARLRDATVGEYDVMRELGRGGMAAVYLAWDLELARYVAVKVMFPELAHQDGMSRRFLREARTAASLDEHPNVVRVYGAREVGGLRFFTMRYIDGCSLEQLLRASGALRVGVACRVFDQVSRALQYAHERGVVHRDVKPSNVMLDRHGTAIVTDFGIARVADGEQLTRAGVVIGTPGYMSPEQWHGEEITAASDQYALGVVAYQMLTGERPDDDPLLERQEIHEAHLRSTPLPLRELRPECPLALEAIVLRMLARAPTARWPNLGEMHEALAAVPREPDSTLVGHLGALISRAMPAGSDGALTPHSPVPLGREVVEKEGVASPVLPTRHVVLDRSWSPPSTNTVNVQALSVKPSLRVSTAPRATPAAESRASRDVTPSLEPPEGRAGFLVGGVTPATATGDTEDGGEAESERERHCEPPSRERAAWRSRARALAASVVVMGGVAVTAFVVTREHHRVTQDARAGRSPAPVIQPAVASARGMVPDGSPSTGHGAEPTSAQNSIVRAADDDTSSVGADSAARVPTRIVVRFSRQSTHLAVGDSLRVWVNVLDAHDRAVAAAVVQVSSSNPARLLIRSSGRSRFAIARAAGALPVIIAAHSGTLLATVSFYIDSAPAPVRDDVASPPEPPHASPVRPSDQMVDSAVYEFVGALTVRHAENLAQLAPADGNSTSARDFVSWLSRARGLRVTCTARDSDIAVADGRATVDFQVCVRWSVRLSKDPQVHVRFRLTLAHRDGAWRTESVQLLERFQDR